MDRKILQKIEYGLYIITSKMGGQLNGCVVNTVMQITSEPCQFAVSINKENLTHDYLVSSGVIAVNFLPESADMRFIGRFGFRTGKTYDKFAETNYRIGVTGAPIITESTVGYMEASINNTVDCGTHTIFICEAVAGEVLSDEPTMSYSYYHQVKKGLSPKNAPTYYKESKPESVSQ